MMMDRRCGKGIGMEEFKRRNVGKVTVSNAQWIMEDMCVVQLVRI